MKQELAVNYKKYYPCLSNKEKRNFKVTYQDNIWCKKYAIDIEKMKNCNDITDYMKKHNFKYMRTAYRFKRMIFQKGRVVIVLMINYLDELYGVNIYRKRKELK